jgi:hypothetical protein
MLARKLRVAIDCRIGDPQQGIGTALLALAKALSDSETTDQEYTFIVGNEMVSWLAPYVYGPCKLQGVSKPTRVAAKSAFFTVKAALGRVAPLRFIWHKLRGERAQVPVSDGYVESGKFDIVHFPTQKAYLTELPSIYQPWDLQHLHYPRYFLKTEFAKREREYRAFCNQASYVCVRLNGPSRMSFINTSWQKRRLR